MSQDTLSKDKHVESTSAFFDGEVAEHELDAWLDDSEAAARWHRYSLISSSLKGDLADTPQLDISAQVSAAIAEEADSNVVKAGFGSRSAAARKAAMRWLQPTGKVAVAAAVAVVAVMTVQTVQQPDTVPVAEEPALMLNPLGGRQPVSYNPSASASSSMAEQQFQDLQRRRQVQSYLIDHQQQVMLIQEAAQPAASETPSEDKPDAPQQ